MGAALPGHHCTDQSRLWQEKGHGVSVEFSHLHGNVVNLIVKRKSPFKIVGRISNQLI